MVFLSQFSFTQKSCKLSKVISNGRKVRDSIDKKICDNLSDGIALIINAA